MYIVDINFDISQLTYKKCEDSWDLVKNNTLLKIYSVYILPEILSIQVETNKYKE